MLVLPILLLPGPDQNRTGPLVLVLMRRDEAGSGDLSSRRHMIRTNTAANHSPALLGVTLGDRR